jgi:photosystem II stability/assembly factor-like uncharacterized protein
MKLPTAKKALALLALLLCLIAGERFSFQPSTCSRAHHSNNLRPSFRSLRQLWRATAAAEARFSPVKVAERTGQVFAVTAAFIQGWPSGRVFASQPETPAPVAPEPSWHKQSNNSLARLQSVHFTDAAHGWAAGSNGTLLKTADGGATWERVALPPQFSRDLVREVWAFDGQRLRLLGEYNLTQRPTSAELDERSFLLASDDGGTSWQEIELARPPEKPRRRKRADTPPSEEDQVERLNSPVLTGLAFAGPQTGWLVGESGTIQSTRDGGAHWQMQYATSRKLFYDVFALDAQQAWIVGGGGLALRTVDGGANWNEQPVAAPQTLRAVQFLDARRGWAAGINGTILATTNGGNRWQMQPSNSTQTLNDVFFVNASEGWAAGDRGTLLRTRNGGATWQDESLRTFANFNKLYFTAPDCGWVVGTNGSIYKFSASSDAPPKGTSR